MAAEQDITEPQTPEPQIPKLQIAEPQITVVRQFASIVHEYRVHPAHFTTFDLMCGMTFGPDPVSAIIRVTPSKKEEQFLCRDKALLEQAGSDREAFFEAVDAFASHEMALAWNGTSPTKDFHVPRQMSLNFAHPTMSAEITLRRKGEADAFALKMLFIAFNNSLAANIYAAKRQGLLR